jgi:hypothetical protein
MDYVSVHGVRAYDASHNENRNDRSSLMAPGISITNQLTSSWFVSASYRYFGNLRGKGLAGSSNVFGAKDGVWTTSLVDYAIEEDIHETSVQFGYSRRVSDLFTVKIGPSLDLDISRASFFSEYFGTSINGGTSSQQRTFLRSFSSTDLRLGGFVSLDMPLGSGWAVGARYRLSTPPDRTLHSFGMQVSYGF